MNLYQLFKALDQANYDRFRIDESSDGGKFTCHLFNANKTEPSISVVGLTEKHSLELAIKSHRRKKWQQEMAEAA